MGTTVDFLTALAALLAPALPWIPAGQIFLASPATPVQLSQWAYLTGSDLRTEHTAADTLGTPEGRPNLYHLWYFETPYVPEQAQATEKLRVYDTYDAVRYLLLPRVGDIPGLPDGTRLPGEFSYGAQVALHEDPSGPFVTWARQPWIGARIEIRLVQEE